MRPRSEILTITPLKATLNKWVFNCVLKLPHEVAGLSSGGRLLQTAGAAAENARSP